MPHHQSHATLQRRRTLWSPAQVLDAAEAFFTRHQAVYTAFLERRGPGHAVFRGQGGEELVIGAQERDGATEATGSSYMFDAQVARFLATLPEAPPPVTAPPAAAAPSTPGSA
jgi:hypothetical protein